MISIDDFKKIEIKIGHILNVENIENSEKLLRLTVDFGEDKPRQVLSGIKLFFLDQKDLVGKRCAFATNLEPRKIMGLESEAMILAVSGENFFSLLNAGDDVPPGAKAN